MKYHILLVGLGGLAGSICRYLLGEWVNKESFPWGTITVNLLGSFCLGLLVGLSSSKYLNLFLGVGFMGGFTTFSSLNLDILRLLQQNLITKAIVYFSISFIFGLLLIFLGYRLGTIKH